MTVRRLLILLATYPDRRELIREFPDLHEDDIREALEFAAANVPDEMAQIASSQ